MRRLLIPALAAALLLIIGAGYLALNGLVLLYVENMSAQGAQLLIGISGHEVKRETLPPNDHVTIIFVPHFAGDVEITCSSTGQRWKWDFGYISSALFMIQRVAIYPCSRFEVRRDYFSG